MDSPCREFPLGRSSQVLPQHPVYPAFGRFQHCHPRLGRLTQRWHRGLQRLPHRTTVNAVPLRQGALGHRRIETLVTTDPREQFGARQTHCALPTRPLPAPRPLTRPWFDTPNSDVVAYTAQRIHSKVGVSLRIVSLVVVQPIYGVGAWVVLGSAGALSGSSVGRSWSMLPSGRWWRGKAIHSSWSPLKPIESAQSRWRAVSAPPPGPARARGSAVRTRHPGRIHAAKKRGRHVAASGTVKSWLDGCLAHAEVDERRAMIGTCGSVR